MTREQAFKALEEGSKVTHKRWNGDGQQCLIETFKAIYGESWDDNDWFIV